MNRFAAILFLTLAAAACGDHGSIAPTPTPPGPVAPTPTPTPPGPLPQGAVGSIWGFVVDTAGRPLAGARVEVVDGPQAGTSATTDAAGQFSLTGTFVETSTFRATKEGHVAATQAWSCSVGTCPGPRNASPWLGFYLAGLAPPVNIAGDYTLTFIADSACAALPNEVRTRTYAATITLAPAPNIPANTLFKLVVSGAPFLEDYNGFSIGVAGDYLSFYLYGRHNPAIVERVAANTYLAFSGGAGASVGTSAVSTISTSFDGWIDYCVLKSEMGQYYGCATGRQCDSPNNRLILTRR